jgi:hypothetical protein
MFEPTTGNPRDLEARVIARAWKDDAFRQELLRDPQGALERELARMSPGASLPADIQVRVVEETPATRYLVLPPKPTVEPGVELSDADLAQVAAAGGRLQTFCFTTPYAGCCDTATN